MARDLFQKVEEISTKGLFMLKDGGLVFCCSCNTEISLFGKGDDIRRVQDHIKSSKQKKSNKAEFQKIKSILNFAVAQG